MRKLLPLTAELVGDGTANLGRVAGLLYRLKERLYYFR
jgi:hypothetical protein